MSADFITLYDIGVNKPDVPEEVFASWQEIVDSLATIAGVPAALIMRVHPGEIEVARTSHSRPNDNPYEVNEKAPLNTGLYCETVIKKKCELHVANSLKDKAWANNPDVALGMIGYFGLPLLWPDRTVYGTICILDRKDLRPSDLSRQIMGLFRRSIENGLTAISLADQMVNANKREANKKLRLSAQVLESTPEGLMVTDTSLRIVSVNRSFCKITGYREEETIGQTPRLLQSGRHDGQFYQAMWQSLQTTGKWQGEIWNRRKDGEIYPEWISISAIYDESGSLEHYAAVYSNLSTQEHIRNRLHNLAYYDPLTRLPNRELFNDRLKNNLIQATQVDKLLALFFLDLDRFKTINDAFGHRVGDELLVAVARRLIACVRESDTVARLGGDEFTLILGGLDQVGEAARVAEDIVNALSQPFKIVGRELFVTCSIGISIYPVDGESPESLIKNADTAMYRAKEDGRNNYQFYEAEMSGQFKENMALSNDLRLALERDELQLLFQPQFDLTNYRIVGVEALLRWEHAEFGRVPPDKFIPLAEEHGLIHAIGDWVVCRACEQAKAWNDRGFEHVRMAVNLSGHQFKQSNLLASVEKAIAQSRINPQQLELELTEGALIETGVSCLGVLEQLKELGVHLAIDDFGTGYSSLGYLRRFPIDRIKVDKCFIDEVADNEDAAAIASTIITMGKDLRLKVVAEGVETSEQLDFLIEQGCDEVQGYLFSRPVSARDMARLLEKQITGDQLISGDTAIAFTGQ